MIYRKYEALPSEWEVLKSLIEVNPESDGVTINDQLVSGIYIIGHVVLEPAVLGENLEIVEEEVVSPKLSVDILWKGEPLPEFEQYEVWPAPPVHHHFAGWQAVYEAEFSSRNNQ